MKATLAMALFGAALITVPATAQTQRPMDQGPRATERTTDAKAPALYQMKAGQWRASKLDGLDVYNPNNEKIGDISELIIDRGGKVEAVVIGVGGFLGMGEHLVAVPFEKVQWVDQPVEHKVSTTERTTTTGSGTSTATAPRETTTTTTTTTDRDRGTAAMNAPANGPVTTSAPVTTTAPANAPATTVDRSTGTTVTTTTANNRNDANNEYRPDHAVVAMTKDQLKALPEVRYSR